MTAEPFPSRLASIARGTGELDGVYHVALNELVEAVEVGGTTEQRRTLAELITQERLFDFAQLAPTLAI